MVSLKRSIFSTCHCVFFLTVVQILVGGLDLSFLTHTKKRMAPIYTCLNFQKHVKMCVYIKHIKSQCNFCTFFGEVRAAKKVGLEVIFSELGFAASGARILKPGQEFKGSALKPFSCCFEA